MEAVRETTGGQFPPHVYLLDGTTLVAYMKWGTDAPHYFKSGIKGFDRRGRKFEKVSTKLFKIKEDQDTRLRVEGSKGAVYWVDTQEKTCTCPGFSFRGSCKHVKEIV